ncbi:MAG: pilin [Patescibacteria group bacterium]|nr:pilin [Patescibacteria group bacterium]
MSIVVKKISVFIFLVAFSLLPILIPVNLALADDSLLSTQEGFKNNEVQTSFGNKAPDDIRYTITRFINIALLLLSVIFLVLVLIAGFKYMTAAGNEEQVKTALKQITQAVIGLVIVLSAWGISFWILMRVQAAVSGSSYLF